MAASRGGGAVGPNHDRARRIGRASVRVRRSKWLPIHICNNILTENTRPENLASGRPTDRSTDRPTDLTVATTIYNLALPTIHLSFLPTLLRPRQDIQLSLFSRHSFNLVWSRRRGGIDEGKRPPIISSVRPAGQYIRILYNRKPFLPPSFQVRSICASQLRIVHPALGALAGGWKRRDNARLDL